MAWLLDKYPFKMTIKFSKGMININYPRNKANKHQISENRKFKDNYLEYNMRKTTYKLNNKTINSLQFKTLTKITNRLTRNRQVRVIKSASHFKKQPKDIPFLKLYKISITVSQNMKVRKDKLY